MLRASYTDGQSPIGHLILNLLAVMIGCHAWFYFWFSVLTESKPKRRWIGDKNAEILSVFIVCKSRVTLINRCLIASHQWLNTFCQIWPVIRIWLSLSDRRYRWLRACISRDIGCCRFFVKHFHRSRILNMFKNPGR
jgi:hypothetical protein